MSLEDSIVNAISLMGFYEQDQFIEEKRIREENDLIWMNEKKERERLEEEERKREIEEELKKIEELKKVEKNEELQKAEAEYINLLTVPKESQNSIISNGMIITVPNISEQNLEMIKIMEVKEGGNNLKEDSFIKTEIEENNLGREDIISDQNNLKQDVIKQDQNNQNNLEQIPIIQDQNNLVQEIIKQDQSNQNNLVQEIIKQDQSNQNNLVQEIIKQDQSNQNNLVQEIIKQDQSNQNNLVQEIIKQDQNNQNNLEQIPISQDQNNLVQEIIKQDQSNQNNLIQPQTDQNNLVQTSIIQLQTNQSQNNQTSPSEAVVEAEVNPNTTKITPPSPAYPDFVTINNQIYRIIKPLTVPDNNNVIDPKTLKTAQEILDYVKPFNPYDVEETEDDFNINYQETNGFFLYEMQLRQIDTSNWNMLDYIFKCPPIGWRKVIHKCYNELKDSYVKTIPYPQIVPQIPNIFKALYLTPFRKIKVVILGQDPYHQLLTNDIPKAQGLSFSIARNDKQFPSSLSNIFQELHACYPDFQSPAHGDLTFWAYQGVLLLNASLTTVPNIAGAHKDFWSKPITKILNFIANNDKHVIYLLWGNDAIKACSSLGDRAIRICSSHPSGLSARKPLKDHPSFIGSRCFISVNQKLAELGRTPINWQVL